MPSNKLTDWNVKHLAQLIGKKVKCVAIDKDEDGYGVGVVYGLEFNDGTTAWILQDPEGNGPGHLDIQN